MARPLKIGVQLPEVERRVLWPELISMTKAAEAVGFDSVWLGDHLLYDLPDGTPRGPWEVYTSLAALAAVTERVQLGSLVSSLGFHDPAMIAKMCATIDAVSGGRLVLGVGRVGTSASTARSAFRSTTGSTDSRRRSGSSVVCSPARRSRTPGSYYALDRCVIDPPPARAGGPLLMVGSNSPRMLSITLAARALVERVVEHLRQHAGRFRRGGRRRSCSPGGRARPRARWRRRRACTCRRPGEWAARWAIRRWRASSRCAARRTSWPSSWRRSPGRRRAPAAGGGPHHPAGHRVARPGARPSSTTADAARALCAVYIGGSNVDILGALDAATDEFGRRLRLVDEGSWAMPTPCSDWDVHYLVAHVIGGNRFAVHVLGGMGAMAAIEQVMSSPQLGDDAGGGMGLDVCRAKRCVQCRCRVGSPDRSSARRGHGTSVPRAFGSSTSRCTLGTLLARSERMIGLIQNSLMSC